MYRLFHSERNVEDITIVNNFVLSASTWCLVKRKYTLYINKYSMIKLNEKDLVGSYLTDEMIRKYYNLIKSVQKTSS